MAVEFIGPKLHESAGRLDELIDEVGDGRANRPEDVVRVKTAFHRLGRLEEPELASAAS